MSSRTDLRAAVLAVAVAFACGTAHAAVQCPPKSDGRSLARSDGGNLYQGDPANNILLAPTQSNPGGRRVNIWNTPDPSGIVLVCRYEGSRTPLVFNLTPDIRSCQQGAGSFSCK